MKRTCKSIANRYGYPIYLYEGTLYLSDWDSYNHRDDYVSKNAIYKNLPNRFYIQQCPRRYGEIYHEAVPDIRKRVSLYISKKPNIVWILPNKSFRRKGKPEAYQTPQELANMLGLKLEMHYSGSVNLLQNFAGSGEQVVGRATRLVAKKFRNCFLATSIISLKYNPVKH